MTSDTRTVLFLPMRFIRMPVGTEKIRNQKNTSEGKRLASETERLRSFLTKFVAVPTRSTKPIEKKQSITGMNCIRGLLAVVAAGFELFIVRRNVI